MTTAAWDGKTLAADSRMDGWQSVDKIFHLKDGRYATGAGTYCQIVEIVAWLDDGSRQSDKPEFTGDDSSTVLIVDGKEAFYLSWPFLRAVKINEPFFAIGSGSEYALGAMAAGKDAKSAVAIAAQFDPQTGGEIRTVKLK